jgi:hypothetical protein
MISCEDMLNLTIVSVYPWDSLSLPMLGSMVGGEHGF